MKKIEQLQRLFEKQKVVYNSDLKALNIDNRFLKIAIEQEICERVCRGTYVSMDESFDSEFINQLKFKNSVFSLQSALVIHQFTDLVHVKPTFFSDKKIDNDKYIILKDNLEVGVIQVENEMGNIVTITDMERTMIDLVRYSQYVDADVYSKTFMRYMTSPEKNLNKIIIYAKELGYFEEVRKVFEVFYGW